MSNIRILPEILANKIAAGEVVERPASVVKELIENSIDASALSIRVEIEAGGKKKMLVRDDGEGMTQDDALLAFEHHATSKLRTIEDLSTIATLGFRGEALPSIASVSRLILRTRHQAAADSEAGSEITIEGGTVRSAKVIPWDRGTEVTVRDLFYNMPARRKFLRSNEAELSHTTRLVTQYALAHPEVRFTLMSEGRTQMDWVPVPSLRERVYQVFGQSLLENLLELSGEAEHVRVHGFTSRPHEQKTNPYSQFFYVNRRMVRDKIVMSAVRQAYRNVLPASAYPVVFIFVDLPLEQVDVNTHPSKIEVRFRQASLVHDLVRETVEEALARSRMIPPYVQRNSSSRLSPGVRPPGAETGLEAIVPAKPGHAPDAGLPAADDDRFQRAFNYPYHSVPASAFPSLADHQNLKIRADLLLGAPTDIPPAAFHAEGVRILGQIHDSYIVACDSQGLLILDQHVAHERVLYEKFSRAIKGHEPESQMLLVPKTLELPPHQMAVLDRVLPELNLSGFSVERFGGRSILIRSVPAAAKEQDCEKLLSEILDGLEVEERSLDLDRIRDRIAVSMACRAAIKVHTPLSPEKMRWLVDELGQTRIPTNCPHGRPVILRFSLSEIERNFGRA